MVKQFTHCKTYFTAGYSPENQAFIYTRVDAGRNTESKVLQTRAEVNWYFRDRVDGFKKVVGLN